MIVLDIPRKFNGQRVDVPSFHRAHLAITSGAQLQLLLMPPAAPDRLPELIVSPIEYEHWPTTWRLTATLDDRPGLVGDVSNELSRHGVNILAAESISIENQARHEIEMLIDVPNSGGEVWNQSAVPRNVRELTWSLRARLLENVSFSSDQLPRLRMKPLYNLRQAHVDSRQLLEMPASSMPFRPLTCKAIVDRRHVLGKSDMLSIPFPKPMREALLRYVGHKGPGQRHQDWGFHLRASDTKDRFLRVLFFKSSDPVVHVRVVFNDDTGAIARICDEVIASGYDLVTSFCSLYQFKKRAYLEFVVRAPNMSGSATPEIKAGLENALSSPNLADLVIEFSYPGDYRRDVARAVDEIAEQPHLGEDCHSPAEWMERLRERVDTKRDELMQKHQCGTLEGRDVATYNLVNSLSHEYGLLTNKRVRVPLFISCHFKEPEQRRSVIKIAEEYGFHVFTGDNLEAYSSILEGLSSRINASTHFLGVWASTGGHPSGGSVWPSTWLPLELGMAAVLKLQWRLLVSEGIEFGAWDKIKGGAQQLTYKEHEFESKYVAALKALAQLKARRVPVAEIGLGDSDSSGFLV